MNLESSCSSSTTLGTTYQNQGNAELIVLAVSYFKLQIIFHCNIAQLPLNDITTVPTAPIYRLKFQPISHFIYIAPIHKFS